ncbi:MAG TPA: hypothetical protein VIL32_02450 [Steroidobacteraceae bacterium]
MQTLQDHLTTYPRALKAANEDFLPAPVSGQDNAERQTTAGWDPYEVWRTRVKAPMDNQNRSPSR